MSLSLITGGGSFTRTNIKQINDNFSALVNPDIWVRPQAAVSYAAADGSYAKPYGTMSAAQGSPLFVPGVVIGLQGVLFECWAPPAINDVTIVGMANQPRQATTSGVPNGGGATWLNATHTATPTASPLVKLGGAATETHESQGWRFQNIYFNNQATGATVACIELLRGDGSGVDVGRDASHASFSGCKFTGASLGIRDSGGCSFVRIEDCEFFNFSGSGDCAIKEGTDTDVALPLQWVVHNNRFWNNANHVIMPWSSADVAGNTFGYIGSSVTTTTQITATSGKNNSVHNNFFDLPYTTNGITAMFALGTNDRWYFNEFSTAVATTIYSFGAPAS